MTATENVCPVHPTYKAIRPPKSKKPGCICHEIWKAQKEARHGHVR